MGAGAAGRVRRCLGTFREGSASTCGNFASMFGEGGVSNFYLTPHRDYEPALGRWLTPDPGGIKVVNLADPQTWNMYAYVTDNPTTLNDPTGLGPRCTSQNTEHNNVLTCEQAQAAAQLTATLKNSTHERAQKKKNNTPAKFVVENKKTENHGSYSTFAYQLENSSGTPLTGTYGVEEHLWSDRAARHHAHIAKNSEGEFVTIHGGEAHDNVGYNPGGPGAASFNVYQTFTVRQRGFVFFWKHYNLHTEFEHETVVNDGSYFNSVIDIVP